MSLRGALNWIRRTMRDGEIAARAEDLTAAAITQDVSRARERVDGLRRLLAKAERVLEQRRWELEVYASHGTVPKRAGLVKRIAKMAASAQKRALAEAKDPPPTAGG